MCGRLSHSGLLSIVAALCLAFAASVANAQAVQGRPGDQPSPTMIPGQAYQPVGVAVQQQPAPAGPATPAAQQPAGRSRGSDNVIPRTARQTFVLPAIDKGQNVFICGHSFHIFLAGGQRGGGSEGPITALAKEAGYADAAIVGSNMIGGSTPMQHWNQGTHETNPVKVALREGKIDVLTLATNAVMPEPGIDLFCDLAYKSNPNVRVLVQMSWGSHDALGENLIPADRDDMTIEDLAYMREGVENYKERMRQQIRTINQRNGKEFAYIVPVHVGVLELRERVLHGLVPGVKKQTDLYRDSLGHGKQPIHDLAAYMYYAGIYRKSPIGLTALDTQKTEESKAQHKVLQEIAWETMLMEPSSGVKLPTKVLPRRATPGAPARPAANTTGATN